jgi:Recombinase
VRLIFHLALDGDGGSAPMGVKAIVNHLNARRIFTRDGGRWGIGQVHRILTRRGAFAHPCRYRRRKIGGNWRAQFCTEMAETEGFEPSIGLYNPMTV